MHVEYPTCSLLGADRQARTTGSMGGALLRLCLRSGVAVGGSDCIYRAPALLPKMPKHAKQDKIVSMHKNVQNGGTVGKKTKDLTRYPTSC